jgi:uncharacterized protein (TIGR03000 family)
MSRFRFLSAAALSLTIFLWATVPTAYGHGGGHGGGGHGGYGHGGYGYGGYHGFGYGGYHGFGYGYRGFGFYGYPGFGFSGFGLGGFGLGGFGFYGLGGLGYGGLGYGGLGYGGLGYGGLGYGGFGMGGFGYGGYGYGGGYGGYSSGCNCCCLGAYPATAILVPVPANGGANPPANGGGNTLPVPNKVSSRSPYVDYYARNADPAAPTATDSSIVTARYVDYYARKTEGADDNKARLHVTLPADAELWLNGQRMHHTGAERDFITPPLKKDETYTYHVRAHWTQDGQPREESIEVKVRANKTTAVQLGASTLAKR